MDKNKWGKIWKNYQGAIKKIYWCKNSYSNSNYLNQAIIFHSNQGKIKDNNYQKPFDFDMMNWRLEKYILQYMTIYHCLGL